MRPVQDSRLAPPAHLGTLIAKHTGSARRVLRTCGRPAALGLILAVGLPAPAAAQEDWLRNLERHLEQHVEALARAFEAQVERMQARETQRNDRGGREATETFSATVRLGEGGTFDLQNTTGDLVVTGSGGSQVRIEAVRRARAASEADARALLQATRVNVIERAGNVEVRTTYPGRRRGGSASVDYTVSVPREANVVLRTVSGEVRVTNVRGDLRADSVSGDIRLSSVQRVRRLNTMSGTLEITDAEGAEIEGSTVSGDVIGRRLRVRTIELTSVSGDLRLSDAQSERVNLTAVSGDVEYAGPLVRNGRYEIRSHSGDVRIMPQGDAGFDVEANTFSGSVRSDYALTLRDGLALGFAGNGNRGLRGTFGGAGAALVLQSFSGDVTILRR